MMEQLIGQKLLLAFRGKDKPSNEILRALREYRPGGITLFRSFNMGTPAQIRALTRSLQKLARGLDLPLLLIAADQEGGQLMAFGDGTPLPGNMALGATRSPELARKAGEVLGREMAALGINVDYAPCVDVNLNPHNPVVGTRSFGEDPQTVAALGSAMVEGIQSQGVAATAKHFPGHGDTSSDSHHGLPCIPHSADRLRSVELPPFQEAMRARVKLIMTAHLALPAFDGPDAPPATLSKNILSNLLRRDLGFDGVVVTDAMDMHAIRQGELLREDALRAAQAGADLLLITSDPQDWTRAYEALLQGAQSGQLAQPDLQASLDRISRLKNWLAENATSADLSAIQCAEHMQVASEIAEKSITLVRDEKNYLPIKLEAEKRIAVIVPVPQDLTPADTSSYIQPKLAESIRAYHAQTDEFKIPYAPGVQETASVLEQVRGYDLVVMGTINACAEEKQAEFVRQLLRMGKPVILIAMRLPYDLSAFPQAPTYVCTYGILEPSVRAVAKALFGLSMMTGRLPVSIPGLG
ncbi:MAG: glycoside hydrolase family 3 protein [Chloroflexi bacterium]|nr:MAG: glycoside hydrolase family 3 protein [Chloroflexota bacterium]